MRTYKSRGKMFDCARRTGDAPSPKRLDMPAARRYLESLLNTNGRFSDADAKTEALTIEALLLLGCDDERVYERAKEYLLSLGNDEWGFSDEPGKDSSLEGTYHAASCLKKLGVEKKEALADYVLSLQRNDGSFFSDEAHSKSATPERGPVHDALNNAAFAVLALRASGYNEEPLFARAEKFIRRQQHLDGSFGMGDGSTKETYYAIRALDELGELDDSACARAEKFVLGMQGKDGGFFSIIEDRYLPQNLQVRKCENVENTFYALSALSTMGRLDEGVGRKAREYVMRLRNDDGGFGYSIAGQAPISEPMTASGLLGTAYAVLCLEIAGRMAKT